MTTSTFNLNLSNVAYISGIKANKNKVANVMKLDWSHYYDFISYIVWSKDVGFILQYEAGIPTLLPR